MASLDLRHEAWSLRDMGGDSGIGQSVACLLGNNSIRPHQLVDPCCKKKKK